MYKHTIGTVYSLCYQYGSSEGKGWPDNLHPCAVWPDTPLTLLEVHVLELLEVGIFATRYDMPSAHILPTMHEVPMNTPVIYYDMEQSIVMPGQDNVPDNLKETYGAACVCEVLRPCIPFGGYVAKMLWQPPEMEYPDLFTIYQTPDEMLSDTWGVVPLAEWEAISEDFNPVEMPAC